MEYFFLHSEMLDNLLSENHFYSAMKQSKDNERSLKFHNV